jgi:DHA1 family multidrug resistance protein-like MFS transporter
VTQSNRSKLLLLLVTALAYRATTNMLQTSLPLYIKYHTDASNLDVSLVMAAAAASSFAAIAYFGLKHTAIKKAVVVGLIALTIGTSFYIVSQGILEATAVSVFTYIGAGVQPLLLTSVVLTSNPARRERNISVFAAMLSLSLILGPLYQSIMLRASNDNLSVSMVSFAPLAALALILFSSVKFEDSAIIGEKLDLSFLKNRVYVLGILADVIYSIPFSAVITFGGILAKQSFDANYTIIELLFSAYFGASLVTRLVSLKIRSKFYSVVMALIVTLLGLTVMGLSTNFSELALSFVLLGVPHGVAYSAGASYIASAVPRKSLAAANLVSSFLFGAVSFGILPVLGVLAQFTGLRESFLFIEAPVALIGVAFVTLFVSRNR